MKALGRDSVASYIKVGLDVAAVLFWIAAIAVGIGLIAFFGFMIAVHAGLVSLSIFKIGDGGDGIRLGSSTDPWQVVLPGLLGAAVIVSGGLVVVRRLKALFQSFTTGDPFNRQNAGHLRAIWIALVAIELGRYAVAALTSVLVLALGQPETANVKVGIKVDLMAWFMIAIVVVLAEVFREGARLKEEQELTI